MPVINFFVCVFQKFRKSKKSRAVNGTQFSTEIVIQRDQISHYYFSKSLSQHLLKRPKWVSDIFGLAKENKVLMKLFKGPFRKYVTH